MNQSIPTHHARKATREYGWVSDLISNHPTSLADQLSGTSVSPLVSRCSRKPRLAASNMSANKNASQKWHGITAGMEAASYELARLLNTALSPVITCLDLHRGKSVAQVTSLKWLALAK